MKRRILAIFLILLIGGGSMYLYVQQSGKNDAEQPTAATASKPDKTPSLTSTKQAGVNKDMYSLTDPTSQWVIANKQRRLQPSDYAPDDLVVPSIKLRSNITSDERQVRKVTADNLKKLSDAAAADGVTLTLESGYRSYTFQVALYNRYVNEQGKAVADTQSARPGFSEHQTGLAADLGGVTKPACNVEGCFKDTPEGTWIAANAYKYGFVIRYPEGKQSVTGYIYEPWHLRYVGTELSTDMHNKNISTLEEYFGLPAAPDYN
jgi:D-alanyl-D-alanine carboxypeptidase